MSPTAAFRGQPLILLAGLLAAWFGLRAALWQSPFADLPEAGMLAFPASHERLPGALARPIAASLAADGPRVLPQPAPARRASGRSSPGLARTVATSMPENLPLAGLGDAAPRLLPASARTVVGHNLLLAAGLSQMALPPLLLAYLEGSAPSPGVPAAAPALARIRRAPDARVASRWSADGWLLLRQGSTASFAADRPSYGRSQAGAVVRYDLARAGRRPQAYVRVSSALSGPREREVAAGVSARPFPLVPARVAAEARMSETARGTEVRPAAYIVSEFPPLGLPFGARGEAYLQAGYVGGRFATGFVDGQGRVERRVLRSGDTELTGGAGVWGGAQKGAARLDVGPTAAVAFRLGDARGRVAADYRFRVAGDAEPASGPALTISAGF